MAHLLTDRTYYKKYINTKFNAAVDDTEKFSIQLPRVSAECNLSIHIVDSSRLAATAPIILMYIWSGW